MKSKILLSCFTVIFFIVVGSFIFLDSSRQKADNASANQPTGSQNNFSINDFVFTEYKEDRPFYSIRADYVFLEDKKIGVFRTGSLKVLKGLNLSIDIYYPFAQL